MVIIIHEISVTTCKTIFIPGDIEELIIGFVIVLMIYYIYECVFIHIFIFMKVCEYIT